jgi:hypothetical protein
VYNKTFDKLVLMLQQDIHIKMGFHIIMLQEIQMMQIYNQRLKVVSRTTIDFDRVNVGFLGDLT